MRAIDVPTTTVTARAKATTVFPPDPRCSNRFPSGIQRDTTGLRGARLPIGLLAAALLTSATLSFGMDWPQYRGPNHDGTSPESILKDWPAEGPRQVWKINVTDGFSSFAVSGGKAYTLVKRQVDGRDQEVCLALNADTGKEIWAAPLGLADYQSGAGSGDGPRSTPTVDGARVYTLSVELSLACLEADSGRVVWYKDLVTEYGAENIDWQNAASPLIDGDLLFVNCNTPGRTLLALHKTDGSLAWRGGTDRLTQATPVAATILGVRQVIFFTQSGLVSVVPETGAVLWRYSFPFSTATAASPVVADDIVFCSAAYGVGAAAVRISKSGTNFQATQLWRVTGNNVGNHWSTPLYHDGYLYGLFGAYTDANLKCLELTTGNEQWFMTGFGPGGIVLVDGHLLVLSDTGDLVLVKPDPSAYAEVARTQAVTGKCWNVPAVSDGRIYARSTSEAVCLDVSVAAPPPVITGFPANVTVSCTVAVPQPDDTLVTATANCAGPVVVSHDADALSNQTCPSRYTITRTYHVTDACGNRTSQSQTITVDDQTAPAITGFPTNMTVSSTDAVPPADDTLVTATANCGGLVVISHDADAVFNQTSPSHYSITRTYHATDACGNHTSQSQTITVAAPAPPLRLQSATLGPDGGLQLSIGQADGTPLDASRVAGIQLLVTTDLAVPLNRWTVVSATGVLDNGVLRFEDPDHGAMQQRFFMAVEKP